MRDEAHVKTDEEIARIQRKLAGFYAAANVALKKKTLSLLKQIQEKADDLKKRIDEAEDKNEKKKYEEEYKSFFVLLVHSAKFKVIARSISKIMFDANQKSERYINSKSAGVYALNYNKMGKDLQKDLRGYTLHPANEKDVEKYSGIEKQKVNEKKDRKWNERNLSKIIIAGALLGLTAEEIIKRAERKIIDRNIETANRQASDMMTGAENEGRMDALYRANDEGFSVKKVWVCTFDNRTRDSHIEYDSIGPVDLDYEYNVGLKKPKDPNCTIAEEVCNCRCRILYDTGHGMPSTRSAREGDVTGSYKRAGSFEGTTSVTVPQMSYKEWIEWRKRQ